MEANKVKGIAFFDFDKTILKVDSGPIYGLQIYRDGLTRSIPTFKAAFGGIGYKLGLVKRRKVARWGVGEYQGLKRSTIAEWMANAYPKLIKPHLSEVVVEKIREHQANGFKTGIVTASPPFFVKEAARDLGMDFVFGSDMLFINGVCMGVYADRYLGGPTKMKKAQSAAESEGLTLEDCWFYSDHVADLALLEAVGTPIAVSPEEKLRRIAMERSWTIISHR